MKSKKLFLMAGSIIILIIFLFSIGWIINRTSSNRVKVVQIVKENLTQNKRDYLTCINEIKEIYRQYEDDTISIYAPVKFDRLEVSTFEKNYGFIQDVENNELYSKSILKNLLNNTGTNTVIVDCNKINFIFYKNLYTKGKVKLIYKINNHLSTYESQLIHNFYCEDSINWIYPIDSVWQVSSQRLSEN